MKALDPIGVSLRGTNLIEASAGTGKTYAITTLYLRALLESDLRVENLLVVTYTRAATSELRDRIRMRVAEALRALQAGRSDDLTLQALLEKRKQAEDHELDEKRLALALRSFDQASIFTIHSFCQRCLTDSAFESGADFDSEFESDDQALIDEITDDFWSKEMYAIEPGVFWHLQASGFRLADARQLCRRAVSDPDLVILPVRQASHIDDLSAFQASYEQMRSSWREQRADIVALLQARRNDLNQTTFKQDQLDAYLLACESFVAPSVARPLPSGHALARLGTRSISAKLKKNKRPLEHAFFELVDQFAEQSQAHAPYFEQQALALKLALVDYARSESRRRKGERRVLSFADLLIRLRAALRSASGSRLAERIARSFPVALIDEFQDTDPVQYEVFRRIYHGDGDARRALFLIGDPKQAIYGFRGADLFTYFDARNDAGERVHTLAVNYRSSPAMIAAINTTFSAVKDSFLYEELQFLPVAPAPTARNLLIDEETGSRALEILFLDTPPTARSASQVQQQCTERSASEIARLLCGKASLDGRAILPGDIAVLVRENRQARAMQDALRVHGIPSVLESTDSVFMSDEATELERVLTAMIEPRNRNAVKAALATTLLGCSGNDVHALQQDEAAWDRLLAQFHGYHQSWITRGFIQAFSHMLAEQGVGARLLRRADGQRKMTNLSQLGELLQERALLGGSGPQVLVNWLHAMRTDADARLAFGESGQLRLESDDAAVKIVTIHKSKGLEYNIVFCPFVWNGKLQRGMDKKWVRFHDLEDDHAIKLDIGSEDLASHQEQSAREALAEDLRLLYVALTRARHRSSIVCGAIKSVGSSGLAYLLLRDDALVTSPSNLRAFAEGIESLDEQALYELLRTRFAAHAELVNLRVLPAASELRYAPTAKQGARLQARPSSRLQGRHWRSASFSSLARGADTERDHDAGALESLPAASLETAAPAIVLADFPRGAHPGQMLHHVFEHLDFYQAKPALIDEQVRASLAAFGFDAKRHADTLCQAFSKILRAPLDASGLRLADVPSSQRLDELEFQFPVCEGGSGFSAGVLAKLLEARTQPPWPASYLASVRSLPFAPLRGFLKGFVDLIFVHNERWYIVDYKSNFLGPQRTDYAQSAMAQSMAEHHYYLQYHLYLAALDRYLRLRLPDYDYETHIGGVFYLYLRGMDVGTSDFPGVFFDRPLAHEVAQLQAALGIDEEGARC